MASFFSGKWRSIGRAYFHGAPFSLQRVSGVFLPTFFTKRFYAYLHTLPGRAYR